MAHKIFTLLSIGVCSGFIGFADAGAFLKVSPSSHEERMSEEDVQTSLLEEVEGTFGAGAASSRLSQLSTLLRPMYAALPKNDKGYLGHSTVRYALHRLFVQRHGWFIKGLDTGGGHRNSTTSAGVLKDQVPAYIQDLFEQRLGGRGFGLHELAVLAATIEHLVHNEAIKKLGVAFKVHGFLPTSVMSESNVDEVLDTYMTSYILGEDLSNMTYEEAMEVRQEMPDVYLHWNETRQFVRAVRRNSTNAEGTAEQKASGEFDFSLVARVAERVGEQFGSFQDTECQQIKSSLVKLEDRGTGRVRLSDFYKPAMDGVWTFQESAAYLRQLGALDESDQQNPRVIIANYISSPSNCIASSSFYSVCCIDECEGLLGHLERELAAPEAQPAEIAGLIAKLSSSSVAAPQKLSATMLDRLSEIAAGHGGKVQLHGRLFAQWMHHVYPRECPYPHLSGSTNPQTPDEWLEATGEETTATEEEMLLHVEKTRSLSNSTWAELQEDDAGLPWSPEEELLVCREPPQEAPVRGRTTLATLRDVLLFATMACIAYSLVHTSTAARPSKAVHDDKLFV